jgi:hypothetical protein
MPSLHRFALVAAAVLAASGIAIAIAASVGSGTGSPVDLAVHTKAAASATAIGVLQEVRLPAGSEPVTLAKIGTRRAVDLDFYGFDQDGDGVLNSTRFWRVPEGINEAASYFERNAPPGFSQEYIPAMDGGPNATGFQLGTLADASLPFSPHCRPNALFTRLTYNLLMSPATPKVTDVLIAVSVYWHPRVCPDFGRGRL